MFKKNSITQGNSLELLKKIPDKSIDLVFADPPYNLQLKDTLYRPDQTTVEAVTNDWDQFDTYQAYDEFSILYASSSDDPEMLLQDKELKNQIKEALKILNQREAMVAQLYYVEEFNIYEISEILEISTGRISQIKKSIIEKLRNEIG